MNGIERSSFLNALRIRMKDLDFLRYARRQAMSATSTSIVTIMSDISNTVAIWNEIAGVFELSLFNTTMSYKTDPNDVVLWIDNLSTYIVKIIKRLNYSFIHPIIAHMSTQVNLPTFDELLLSTNNMGLMNLYKKLVTIFPASDDFIDGDLNISSHLSSDLTKTLDYLNSGKLISASLISDPSLSLSMNHDGLGVAFYTSYSANVDFQFGAPCNITHNDANPFSFCLSFKDKAIMGFSGVTVPWQLARSAVKGRVSFKFRDVQTLLGLAAWNRLPLTLTFTIMRNNQVITTKDITDFNNLLTFNLQTNDDIFVNASAGSGCYWIDMVNFEVDFSSSFFDTDHEALNYYQPISFISVYTPILTLASSYLGILNYKGLLVQHPLRGFYDARAPTEGWVTAFPDVNSLMSYACWCEYLTPIDTRSQRVDNFRNFMNFIRSLCNAALLNSTVLNF